MFIQEPFNLTGGVAAAGGYEIDYSCRFNPDDSSYLIRTSGDAGTPKTWTIFMYCKRGVLGTLQQLMTVDNGSDTNTVMFQFNTSDELRLYFLDTSTALTIDWKSTRVFRDPHAWYFFTFTMNTVPSTPIFKIWNWNDEITAWDKSTADSLAQNDVFEIGTAGARYEIGAFENGTGRFLDGYLAQCGYMDGTVVTSPVDGGLIELDDNGVYRPLNVSGLDFGTAGHFLDFADSNDLGNDVSGNNNFTSSGMDTTNRVPDTPTTNWATLSSISGVMGAGAVTLSDGNLDTVGTVSTSSNNTICSHTVTSGKWVWAVKPGSPGQAQNSDPWIFDLSSGRDIYVNQPNNDAAGWGSSMDTTSTFVTYHNGGNRSHTVSPIFATNDLHLMAADIDNLKLWCGYYDANADTTNWMDGGTGITGDPGAGTDQTWTLTGTHFAFGTSTYGTRTGQIDFGQRTGIIDQITIPTGFQFLNTTNLAVPSIADPSAHFQATLYTGTGSSPLEVNQSATTAPAIAPTSTFKPDLVITKKRSGGTERGFCTADAVRLAEKYVLTDTPAAEVPDTESIKSFDDDGFTVGDSNETNEGTNPYVGFQWLGDNVSGGTSNTDGNDDTMGVKVNANDTAGFSIVTYTGNGTAGATVGHGLSAAPDWVIVKNRDQADAWWVYMSSNINATSAAKDEYLVLDTSAVSIDSVTAWNDTAPISDVFTVGDAHNVNADGEDYVAYCFRAIAGYSAAGTYTGDGADNADGPLIITGFTPAFVLWKSGSDARQWLNYYAAVQDKGNPVSDYLLWDVVSAENSNAYIDFLSNGFRCTMETAVYDLNKLNATYNYLAFARHPFGGHGGTFGGGAAPATAK